MPTDNVVEESEAYRTLEGDGNARLFRNWLNLEKDFDPWKAVYREISDYIAPGRGRFVDSEQANQRTRAAQRIINPVAADALHMMGAGLHGGLSSPARPWFQLSFTDPELDKFAAGRKWLDDCEKILYAMLRRTNFYSVIHNVYEECGGFGTGCLFIDSHPKHTLNFSYLTAGDYRFVVDERSRTQSLYRKIRMQVHQMAAMFGKEALSDTCRRMLQANPYDWREVLHVIEPRESFVEGSMFAKQMPFRSVYVEWKEPEKVLVESGFIEMPIVTPRWQCLSHEAYGWGPGLEALSLSKALQKMEINAQLVEDKYLDPPMGVPSGFKDRMVDLSPGAKNVNPSNADKFQPLVVIDPRAIQIYEEKMSRREKQIRELFFNDLFLMIAQSGNNQMTATEVNARQEEKMIMLGPAIHRLLYEMLDPIIERSFAVCARAQIMPPPPPDIANAEYKVEYVSILAQAQKLVHAQSMQSYLNVAAAAAQLNPASVDKTDFDKLLENYGDVVNLPFGIVREDDETQEIRQTKADEAARQQAMIDAQNQADVVQKMGNTPATEDTALSQLEESMGSA